jgi:hypothetical protein
MIEIGDCFETFQAGLNFTFKIVKILSLNLVECEVFCNDRKVGFSQEHRNTLLRMQKLSSLEKELM